MPIAENEALASLRILVAVARADGTIHTDERRSLSAALESLELPGGLTVDRLLGESPDLDVQLRELTSPEAREQIYRSAYFMAYADGTCSKEEQALLDRIAAATDATAETRTSLDRIFVGRASGGYSPSKIAAIEDAYKRTTAVENRISRYSVLSGVLGAFPIPGLAIATDLAVIGLQLKMISDIGAFWGRSIDRRAAKSLLYGAGLGTGARLAVNNLAKLLPGWGSVIGATTSFVSTFALGKVMERYFESGVDAPDALRSEFKVAEAAARAVYADQKDVIIQSQRMHKATLETLTADLKAGTLSQDEFDQRVADLA